jgi:hypothetical protein
MRIEIAEDQRLADEGAFNEGVQMLSAIEVSGAEMKVEGWFDSDCSWGATVKLSPEQRAALVAALGEAA